MLEKHKLSSIGKWIQEMQIHFVVNEREREQEREHLPPFHQEHKQDSSCSFCLSDSEQPCSIKERKETGFVILNFNANTCTYTSICFILVPLRYLVTYIRYGQTRWACTSIQCEINICRITTQSTVIGKCAAKNEK